jgi:thiol-disulfide isomerase/thioredoxin
VESWRNGYDVIIQYENGSFEYKGTSLCLYSSSLAFNDAEEDLLYIFVVEPGDIEVILHEDSTIAKSKTIVGENSIAVYKAINTYLSYVYTDIDLEALQDSVLHLIRKNRDNFAGIFMLNTMGRCWPLFELDELETFLKDVKDPMYLQSIDYRELYAYWMSLKDSINEIDQKAINYTLADIDGNLIAFNEVSKGKVTLVEHSSSWCGNSIRTTRSFMPVYEIYKNKGFEIITIVCESDYDRWVQWVENEKIPWIALIELDTDINNEVLYSDLLFSGGNYLVDMDGIVIAKDLSADELNNLLEKEFE